jgi:hypothetical protein
VEAFFRFPRNQTTDNALHFCGVVFFAQLSSAPVGQCKQELVDAAIPFAEIEL